MSSSQLVRFALTVFVSAALLVPSPASAQGTTVGIKGGSNISNATFKVPDGSFSVTPDSRAGLVIGGFVARDFNQTAGLVVEGLFSQKGAIFNFTDTGNTIKEDVRLNYVAIPVLGRVNLRAANKTTVHIFGGPSFAFKASDTVKETVNGVETTLSGPDEPNLKGNDVGLVLGAAVDIQRFVIDARYTWGLMNINKDTGTTEPEVGNRAFAIMFGVNLWSKR